jgi:uncharacterized protein (DUF58 family)
MTTQIHYRIAWRSRGAFPGAHASTQSGGGLEFSHHVNLLDAPDPRRLDLHASLKDPLEQWLVRRFRQRGAISVYVLADLSASMGFSGQHRKLDVLGDLTTALSYSATRAGDRFGFIGCDQALRAEYFLPPTQRAGAGAALAEELRTFRPEGRGADALTQAAAYLARQRSLVFLVSDFHFPLEQLDAIMAGLTRHQVVPVVIWDRAEFAALPRWGLARLRDAESRRDRLVFLTPRFAADWAAMFAARRAELEARFAQHNARALILLDGFRADQVTAYFHDAAPAQAHAAHTDALSAAAHA